MSVTDLLWRFPSVQMAWRNLGRNRVRTALAALGIIIGVVAISSLGIAGVALQQQATTDLGSLTNEVSISAGPDSTTDGVTDEQVEEIRSLAGDAAVVPQKSNATTLSARDGTEAFVSVTAVRQASALYTVSAGDSPDRLESGALLTGSTAERLGIELGDPVEYDGRLYRVRGLVESSTGFGGGSELVVPLSALAACVRSGWSSIPTLPGAGPNSFARQLARSVRQLVNPAPAAFGPVTPPRRQPR